MTSIHPTAIVEAGAQVDGASIGPWCHVGPAAVIEPGARLVSHVVVDGNTRIGRDAVRLSGVGNSPSSRSQ